jgi:hypothetical protein
MIGETGFGTTAVMPRSRPGTAGGNGFHNKPAGLIQTGWLK